MRSKGCRDTRPINVGNMLRPFWLVAGTGAGQGAIEGDMRVAVGGYRTWRENPLENRVRRKRSGCSEPYDAIRTADGMARGKTCAEKSSCLGIESENLALTILPPPASD